MDLEFLSSGKNKITFTSAKKERTKKDKEIRSKLVSKLTRVERIKTCTTCNGQPLTEPFEVNDMVGTKCVECEDVVTWSKK